MWKTYLTIALRQLAARRLYSIVNVAGLTVGLACFILIALFVRYETGHDAQWANADRIFRISRDVFPTASRTEAHPAGIAGPVAALLESDFPEIEAAARIEIGGGAVRSAGGEPVLETKLGSADNALFRIFDFDWISGDPETALTRPSDIVLTESAARRHFGDADPVGRTLEIGGGAGGWLPLEVVGVIEDLPPNTHLDFSMLSSLRSFMEEEGGRRFLSDWDNDIFYTYALLRPGADIDSVSSRSAEFFERRLAEGSSAYTDFAAMAVRDIHLRSNRDNEMKPPGSLGTAYSFAAIAAFILLLACINFTNLATAAAARRVKEIGVRKAIGAERHQVAMQFLAEAVLQTLIASLLAVTAVELALPAFERFLGYELAFDYVDPKVAGALGLLALAAGLVAGAYPSLYLSAFEPARALRRDGAPRSDGAAFRSALIVMQFAIAIVLMVGTAVTHGQMRFVRGIELGYDKDQIVIVSPNIVGGERWRTLKRELLAHPGISSVAASDVVPFEQNVRTAELRAQGSDARARVEFVSVDDDFFETYGMALVAGRSFSTELGDRPAEGGENGRAPSPFVINELAARALGWTPDAAVGRRVAFGSVQGTRFQFEDASGPIVGVVKDAHLESAHGAIAPVVYRLVEGGDASVKVTGSDLADVLRHIDATWAEFSPDVPVTRRFLDQDFDALYAAEEREAAVFSSFAGLAIFVACLGLFGLASFATESRTKEIGIRKAMGASVPGVVRLFTSELGRLVLIANAVAWPIAYLLVQRWLEAFAYRIDVGLGYFVGSGLLTLVVALATVSAVALRAAVINPVRSLRYE